MKFGILLGLFFGIICLATIYYYNTTAFSDIFSLIKPTQESFTELYFDDHLSLPTIASGSSKLAFKYVIHNFEHKNVVYPVQIQIQPNSSGSATQIVNRTIYLLKDDETKKINAEVYLSGINSSRAKVIVSLENLNQEIFFWIDVADFNKAASSAAEDASKSSAISVRSSKKAKQ